MSDQAELARAQARYQQIIELSGERRYAELTELVHDPSTRELLELLPEASRERAELHLKAVERWEARRRETSLRRLSEARTALDGLDLELAQGLVNKVDSRFLTEEERAQRDQLLLDISARRMELESLQRSGRELWEEAQPRRQRDDRRPWWRRWFG